MLSLRFPLDMHVHLRQEEMLSLVAPYTARQFSAAVIMPNLRSEVDSLDRVLEYRREVLQAVSPQPFLPLMTLFFRPYSREELQVAKPHIVGVKIYPRGMTTHSEGGVADLRQAEETLALLEELDIPLLIHGEADGFVMEREHRFLPYITRWAKAFPRLRMMLEHITTRAAVDLLDHHDRLFASMTIHHLLLTLDDVIGDHMRPHLFCKPIPKTHDDRAALRSALLHHPKVFFGSDSAPHFISAKEGAGCAAGIFSAPVALAALATLLEKMGRLDRLQPFVSTNAINAYELTPRDTAVYLEREPWTVPERIGSVVPFLARETLPWRVVDAPDAESVSERTA